MDTRRGLEDLRELAAGLHPAVLAQHGLAPAVRALADQIPIPVEIDVPAIRLPAPIEGSLYFFCSEALTNIVEERGRPPARGYGWKSQLASTS